MILLWGMVWLTVGLVIAIAILAAIGIKLSYRKPKKLVPEYVIEFFDIEGEDTFFPNLDSAILWVGLNYPECDMRKHSDTFIEFRKNGTTAFHIRKLVESAEVPVSDDEMSLDDMMSA